MSIETIKPAGFDKAMRAYADLVKPWDMYVQGIASIECAVWLRVNGVNTMIGCGSPDEALAEAELALSKQLENVKRQIADRKTLV
jgi:hypothetical protein